MHSSYKDPRVTFVEPLQRYLMNYTAYSPHGPRIALAQSKDLFHWQRLGLATFAPFNGIALDSVDDKDASLFPVPFPIPPGIRRSCLHKSIMEWCVMSIPLLHRPLF